MLYLTSRAYSCHEHVHKYIIFKGNLNSGHFRFALQLKKMENKLTMVDLTAFCLPLVQGWVRVCLQGESTRCFCDGAIRHMVIDGEKAFEVVGHQALYRASWAGTLLAQRCQSWDKCMLDTGNRYVIHGIQCLEIVLFPNRML